MATWKQEIPNLSNSSGETWSLTPDPLLRKPPPLPPYYNGDLANSTYVYI